jgi:hypothetical protein
MEFAYNKSLYIDSMPNTAKNAKNKAKNEKEKLLQEKKDLI